MPTSTTPSSETRPAGVRPPDGEAHWLSDSEQAVWRGFLDAARLVQAEVERGLSQFGLSGADYAVLVSLSEAPLHRQRMSELAQATLLEKSRLSHQVTRMERSGLVQRESCPGDRRGQFAVLTERGWETIRTVAPHHVELVRAAFLDQLSPDDKAALARMLAVVTDGLRGRCSSVIEEQCGDD